MRILIFLYDSLQEEQGTIFIYHQSIIQEDISFHIQPSLVLSIQEFQKHDSLFIFPIQYKVVSLLLSNGYIYQKLMTIIPSHWKNIGPIFNNQNDIEKDKYLLCIIHPQKK